MTASTPESPRGRFLKHLAGVEGGSFDLLQVEAAVDDQMILDLRQILRDG